MNSDSHPPLEPWTDPALEARVVALVLGEAGDFERAELARLMVENPELAAFERRIRAVHGLLGEACRADNGDGQWRLADERRGRLMKTMGAGQESAAASGGGGGWSRFRLAWPGSRWSAGWSAGLAAGLALFLGILSYNQFGASLRLSKESAPAVALTPELPPELALGTPRDMQELQNRVERLSGAPTDALPDSGMEIAAATSPPPPPPASPAPARPQAPASSSARTIELAEPAPEMDFDGFVDYGVALAESRRRGGVPHALPPPGQASAHGGRAGAAAGEAGEAAIQLRADQPLDGAGTVRFQATGAGAKAIHPAEYEPPELPSAPGNPAPGRTTSFPVTPATPTDFDFEDASKIAPGDRVPMLGDVPVLGRLFRDGRDAAPEDSGRWAGTAKEEEANERNNNEVSSRAEMLRKADQFWEVTPGEKRAKPGIEVIRESKSADDPFAAAPDSPGGGGGGGEGSMDDADPFAPAPAVVTQSGGTYRKARSLELTHSLLRPRRWPKKPPPGNAARASPSARAAPAPSKSATL
jgi:hypothetical protein